jgi:hypothetical protein
MMALAILAMTMLATPLFGTVNACGHRSWGQSTEKILVRFGGPYTPSPPETKQCGDWQIGRGGTLYYYGPFAIVDISIPGPPILLVGGGSSKATSLWTANYIVNINSGKGILCWDVVITVPEPGETPLTGTFEGYVIQFGTFEITGASVSQLEGSRYGVLRGTGDFEGWKLVISAKTTGGMDTFENYMYKPVT